MVDLAEVENLEFKWGKKRGIGGKKKDVQFYESFTYDGVEYTLYDSVYLYKEEQPEPYIGKLIKIWENADKTKRVKVLWFFRPSEISNFLGKDQAPENELFLACGEGVGLANINPLEAIAGKCNVVCTSKDSRNPQPTNEELQLSDFIFYRTFDVGLRKVLDKIDEKIAGIEVQFIFNRTGFQKSVSALKVDLDKKEVIENATSSVEPMISAQQNIHESITANTDGGFVGTSTKEHVKPSLVKQKSSLSEKPDSNVDVESGGRAKTSKGLEDVSSDSTNFISKVKHMHGKVPLVKRKSVLGEKSASGEGARIGEVVIMDRHENLIGDKITSSSKIDFEKSKVKGGKVLEVKEEVKSTEVPGELDSKPSKKSKLDSSLEVYDDKIQNSKQYFGHDFDRIGAKRKLGIVDNEEKSKTKIATAKDSHGIDRGPSKKLKVDEKPIKPTNGKLVKTSSIQPSIVEKKTDKQVLEVAQRPYLDRSKWFKELPWEERIRVAHEQGTLVLLVNLDPSYNSIEVEDIVWHAFKENCSAKMIQRIAFSSPHSGQAYVIFKTREAAEKVVTNLDEGCLVLSNGRPLVASIRAPCFMGKQSTFVGHLVIDKLKFQMQREMREAVSTSHCSQPNTLEYDMAVEWCMLQEKLHCAWKKLYEQQGQELRRLKAKLKPK